METVPGYNLLGRAGTGSAATVWKARDVELDRTVALKQLESPTEELREQWRAEARVLANLDDPHVVRVYGYAESDESAYIVEEWVEGATLAAVLAGSGRLAVDQALGVVRGALLGLAHAHERGVVHCDVKPSNILVDQAGVSHLIDFGLATSAGTSTSSGSPLYKSPEAAEGLPVSAASDVYSAGLVLAHLLTGETTARPDLGDVAHRLRPVLAKALDPIAERRYPDARTFLDALSEEAEREYGAAWWTEAGLSALVAAAGTTLVGGALEGAGAKAVAGARRTVSRGLVGAGAAAVVVIAAVVVLLMRGNGTEKDNVSPVSGDPAKQSAIDEQNGGSPSPASPLSPDDVVNGRYHETGTVTSVSGVVFGPDGKRVRVGGEIAPVDWTVQATCDTETHCGGTIVSSSGRKYTLQFTGVAWLAVSDNEVVPCHEGPGTNSVTRAVVITPPTGATAAPAELDAQQTVTTSGTCGGGGKGSRSEGDLVLTRIS